MINFDGKLALKYLLFLVFMLIIWRLSNALFRKMNYDFENLEFKKTEIRGIVKDFIYANQKRKKGVIIQSLDKPEQVITYNGGCGFVGLIYYSTIGDSIFKERDTFRIRIKNTIRDTIINDDL